MSSEVQTVVALRAVPRITLPRARGVGKQTGALISSLGFFPSITCSANDGQFSRSAFEVWAGVHMPQVCEVRT